MRSSVVLEQEDHSPELTADETTALRAIVEGTADSTGEAFFQSLVRHLAMAIDAQYAFVAEFAEVNSRARTLAFWAKDRLAPNIEFDLRGTPCEEVVRGSLCHHPSGVPTKFPDDYGMIALGIESYLGVPLRDNGGAVLGHLAVFDERPMPARPRRLFVFRVFAARAAAELVRIRADAQLRASEERYRDLYEEAPIAYLSVGTDGRLRTVNRRATEWLGYSADELIGRPLGDFFAKTAVGQPQGEKVFRQFLDGEEVAGAELELRRKDGRPLWVSLWIKPMWAADGSVCSGRTIGVDITDRVLAEQERVRLEQQNLYLQEEIKSARNFEEIIGRSPALAAVLENVRRVARTDASVLITGETGTGKELIARAIHSISKRQEKPLIKVNCAALPSGLVESELFGHEKGAFTGAIARRIGRFELADGGTIFLDEVGELPLDTQAKLLRVLQEREFDRVGGRAPQRVDVRVIAATNRDLAADVREKAFREDLFYRLNVFPIELPPLRNRKEDIPLLVHYLCKKSAIEIGKSIDGISPETIGHLQAYHWPGNVRELENVVERAVILATGPVLEIGRELLPISDSPQEALPAATSPASLEAVERSHILSVLDQTSWRIDGRGGAARILQLHPNTLRSRMKKLGISRVMRN
ncbi:MAG: sigma 54-interacting transcriptional regulator [Pirellulales bacterium]|nr:sigma 54-interacting transcriptional regulator [Pirellulales bacterium]